MSNLHGRFDPNLYVSGYAPRPGQAPSYPPQAPQTPHQAGAPAQAAQRPGPYVTPQQQPQPQPQPSHASPPAGPYRQPPAYAPSYPGGYGGGPGYGPSASAAAAAGAGAGHHDHSSPPAAGTTPSPPYPSYPPYGGYPPPPQPQSQQSQQSQQPQQGSAPPAPTAYVPHEVTREEVVDEAIAATSQHWVKTQLRRETERRYEQLYGSAAPLRADAEGTADDDGYARENPARRVNTGGAASSSSPAAAAKSAFGPRRHVEFHVGSPHHVVRLAVLFFATLFGVLPLMSTFSFTVLLCGVVLVYISDYLGYHRSTVFVLLGSAALFAAALFLSNFHAAVTSFGPMLMLVDLSAVLVVVVAATVQHFRWVQETFPNVLCALERLVFAVGPVVALPPLLTTTTALVGSRFAPFVFLVVMCTLHNYFYCPLRSSFLVLAAAAAPQTPAAGQESEEARALREAAAAAGVHARRRNVTEASDGAAAKPARRGKADGDLSNGEEEAEGDGGDDASSEASTGSSHGAPMQLNEQPEALIFSCLVLLLPVAVYNCFQSNWPDNVVANMLNSVALVCGALAYFCVSPVHSLWFLSSPPDSTYSLAQQLEYDPLGLMDLVGTYRIPVLTSVSLTAAHWGAYRVLNSRYSYLFSGLPHPFNAIVLLLALYITAYVVIEIKKLIDVDSKGGDVTRGKYLLQRSPVLVGSCVAAILICTLMDAPAVFYFPCVMSVMAFNLFLTDRTNGGPMFTFTVFTSLLLLWWMYRTYSFIVIDLHVFGEAAVIPTPVVAVSVLWCYVLGCMCFTMAFSPNKTPLTIVMFLLALQLTFVEHVLYSQREEGVYPALLVAFTSAVGVAVPCRMHANGVLPVYSASLIASCYVAKFFTFVVETTSAYYAEELQAADAMQSTREFLLVTEMTGGWWVALFACHLVATFEIERRRRVKIEAARRLFYTYAGAAALLSLLTIRNVQRAVYEFLTQSYVSEQELPHIAAGTCCAAFALLTLPVWWRMQSRYPVVYPLRTISRCVGVVGVVLLAVQPSRVLEQPVSDFDYEFEYASLGRCAAAVGLLVLIAARFTLVQRIPTVLRVVWWLGTAAALALGITGYVQVAPTFVFYLLMLGLTFAALLLIDVAHYREVSGMVLFVVYGLSVLTVPLSFLQFNRSVAELQQQVRFEPDRVATLWDMYEQGSMRLLSVVVVVHLGLAVLLNCRLSGRPLLPRCKEMDHNTAMSLGVILNFSTELSVALLCAINFYGNDSEPAIYVMSCLLLLLFVNDDVMFFGLREHNFRYFPPAACAFAVLWMCTLWNAWRMGAASLSAMSQLQWVTHALMQASLTVPAQVSLLVLLWKGRKMGSSPGFVVAGSVALNVVCLLFVTSKPIQWMAIVGICGQCARLFDSQLRPTTGRRRRQAAF